MAKPTESGGNQGGHAGHTMRASTRQSGGAESDEVSVTDESPNCTYNAGMRDVFNVTNPINMAFFL